MIVPLLAVVACALPAAPLAAQPQQVFFSDFDGEEGVPPEVSGVATLEPVGMLDSYGTGDRVFSGLMLTNHSGGEFDDDNHRVPGSPTVFTLAGLPEHQTVNLNFLLGIIHTWDATDDVLRLSVDGPTIFQENFDFLYDERQTYQAPPGVLLTPFGGPHDGGYDMTFEPRFQHIPHTADTLRVEISAGGSNWEGEYNEWWGVDSFEVTVNPEPGTLGMVACAVPLLVRRPRRLPARRF